MNYAQDTRGKPIQVGGKTIQLPPDAYVENLVIAVSCVVPNCAEPPEYKIVRGRSSIYVAINSGRIRGEQVSPGEERTFDFLRQGLR